MRHKGHKSSACEALLLSNCGLIEATLNSMFGLFRSSSSSSGCPAAFTSAKKILVPHCSFHEIKPI